MGDLTDEADVDASLLARTLSTWHVSTKVAAYVVADKANPTADEQVLLAELRKQFHCDLVDDDDVADAKMDYTAYSAIIVGHSSDVAKLSNLTNLAIPLIFTKGEHAATIGKMATVGAGNYGTSTGTQCDLTSNSHPTVLTEALGVHDIYTTSGNFGWLLSTALASGVGVFANIEGEPTHIGLAVLPLDGINSDSLASPEIRYLFGAQEPSKYTSHTQEHVKWIADWIVHQIALVAVVYSLEQSRVIQDMLGRGQFKLPTNLYDYLVTGTTGSAPFEVITEQESRSIMERLEWIKNGLRRGTGTILPANKSLYDVIVLDRLDNVTYGLAALNNDLDTLLSRLGDPSPSTIKVLIDAIEAKLDNGTYGLSALRTLLLAVGTLLIDIEGTGFTKDVDSLVNIRGYVDEIEGLLKNATYGLSALKTLIDALEAKLDNATYGLSALKTLINAIEAKLDNATYGLAALNTDLDTLLGRLTATRAGYLENLSGGAVALESGGNLAAVKTDVDNLTVVIKFPSAEALDAIAVTDATDTTEKTITVALPTGSSIVRVMLAAFITAMNNTANAQKIDIDVKGRVSGGGWSTFFSQDDVIGFPAADGATTGMVPLQDVSALVTSAQTYGFKCTITQSSANSVRYTINYLLILTYKMS